MMTMSAKRTKKGTELPKSDGGITVRLPEDVLVALDQLCGQNASKRSEELRRAVVNHLRINGLWPQNPGSTCQTD